MRRLEALNKLKTEDVENFLKKYNDEIHNILISPLCSEKMIQQMESLIPSIQVLQEDTHEYKIEIFQFSYLRSKMASGKIHILLQAFSEKWYFDNNGIQTIFYFEEFDNIIDKLNKHLAESKNKRGLWIEKFDINNVLMELGVHLAMLAFISFKTHIGCDNLELNFLKQVEFNNVLEIRAGDYMGENTILYQSKFE